ncbi:MAG: hypothetical protein ACRENO_01515, partial [Thermodesulfobacteriota bacterium]
ALNNPYKYNDPDGEDPVDVITLALDGVSLFSGQLTRFVEPDSTAYFFLQSESLVSGLEN